MSFDPEKVRRFDNPPTMGVFMTMQDGGGYVLYEEYAQLLALLHDVSREADPAGTLRELRLAQDTIRALENENAELKKVLTASERWRQAYRDGKGKLYSIGGAVAEAAINHLPCNEGPLDRASWKTIGVLEIRSEVIQIAQLEATVEDLRREISRLKEERK